MFISLVLLLILIFPLPKLNLGQKPDLNFSELPNNTKYIIGNHHIYMAIMLELLQRSDYLKSCFCNPGFDLLTKDLNTLSGIIQLASPPDFQISNFRVSMQRSHWIWYINLTGVHLNFFNCRTPFGYGLTGKWEASDGTSSKVHFGNDPVDDLKPFDYGLDFGCRSRIWQNSDFFSILYGIKNTFHPESSTRRTKI